MMTAVYKAINAVQADLSVSGIAKARRNSQGAGYNFRGIDDVYQSLSPLLAKHGLCIIPRMVARTCEERQSKAGGALFYVTIEAEFDFVAAEDGSRHTARTFGEAMDSGDKATNKAMSAAYKYAAFMAFAIPVDGNHDADEQTHEVVHGMSPSRVREWLDAIGAAAADELEPLVRDGLAAATECRDREAYSVIRTAGKARSQALLDGKG